MGGVGALAYPRRRALWTVPLHGFFLFLAITTVAFATGGVRWAGLAAVLGHAGKGR